MDTTDKILKRLRDVRASSHGELDQNRADLLLMLVNEIEEFLTQNDFVNVQDLVGVKELSEILSVSRTSVSNWEARKEEIGAPDPVAVLACGKIYAASRHMKWWANWIPGKGNKSGSLPPGYESGE